jgi:hypothetical protein
MSLWLDELTDLAPRLVAENSLHHITFVGVGTGILWGLSRSILQGATNADCVVMLKQTVYVWRLRPGNAPPTARFQVPFCNTQRAMEIADMRRTGAAR